jgi:hypothetical protein
LEIAEEAVEFPCLSQQSIQHIQLGRVRATRVALPSSSPLTLLSSERFTALFEALHLPAKLLLQSVYAAPKIFLGLLQADLSLGPLVTIRGNGNGVVL